MLKVPARLPNRSQREAGHDRDALATTRVATLTVISPPPLPSQLLRLARAGRLLSNLVTISPDAVEVWRVVILLFTLLYCAHLIGCLFWMLGEQSSEATTWVDSAQGSRLHEDSSLLEKYLLTLYWAITTLTTVGYGDISATNSGEMVFCIAIMVLGAVLYAIVLGSVTAAIHTLTSRDLPLSERQREVAYFVKQHRIPQHMADRLQATTEAQWEMFGAFEGERSMLDGLPPELRTDVLMMIHRPSIIKVPLFARFHESFTQMMVRGLERHLCLPGTVLFKEGGRGDRLYLLHQGALEVLESWAGDAPVALMKEGALFGETAIISPALSRRSATVRARDRSVYYSLTRQHMADILVYFPEVRAVLESEAQRLLEGSTRSRKIIDNAGDAEDAKEENLMLTLTVDVIQARHLPEMDLNGLADPYCQLRVDDGDEQRGPKHAHAEREAGDEPGSPHPHKAKRPVRFRTVVVKKNLAPKWRETFYFKVWLSRCPPFAPSWQCCECVGVERLFRPVWLGQSVYAMHSCAPSSRAVISLPLPILQPVCSRCTRTTSNLPAATQSKATGTPEA